MFRKKKEDYGYNDFQIVYATLKWKLKQVDDLYYYMNNNFERVLKTHNIKLIKEKIQAKHKIKQQLEYLNRAVYLADYVLTNYQCLFESPEKLVRDKYMDLCSYRTVVGIPQLNDFWIKHGVKDKYLPPPKEIDELTETELEKEADKYLSFSYNQK